MDYYLYNVKLPFSGITIFYRDLNSKEQISLAKITVYFPITEEYAQDYLSAFKKIIINCVENKDDLLKLNNLDFFLFLIKLRIVSLDKTLELQMDTKEENIKTIKISIDLDDLIKRLYEVFNEFYSDNIIEYKGINVILDFPNLKNDYVFFQKDNLNFFEFIRTIRIKNEEIDFNGFAKSQKETFFENLPISLKNKIDNNIINFMKKLNKFDLFKIKYIENFNFGFYNRNYLEFIKLMFSFNLNNLYQEYYLLASKNINLSYIDNISIADKTIFCKLIENEYKSKTEPLEENQTDLQSLIDEFEG
jgi:hypothetical protein